MGRRCLKAPFALLRERKPAWAVDEIVRLKAGMPEAGCRRLAHTFNRIHAARHRVTVSKTWVADTLRRKRYEVQALRARWKRQIPRPLENNHTWGMDITGKADIAGRLLPIVGLIDHGSRLALSLETLGDKTTIALLRTLLNAIERFGKPRALRTDNEAVFTSWLFRYSLWFLGIEHQRTALHCPWMNGRIERLFGTLKEKLNRWPVDSAVELSLALGDFRTWYNHVRPHQHLAARTPEEAWLGIDPFARPPTRVRYFSAWDGLLTGYWMRR